VIEITSQTIESANGSGKLGLTGKSVTHRVRRDAGDPTLPRNGDESSARDPRSLRDRCRSRGQARDAVPEGGLALEALLRTGAARLTMRWAKPLETGAQTRPSENQGDSKVEINIARAK
jgi:hypothetical protein